MKQEVFAVENGVIVENQIPVFKDLSLQIFTGEITGMVFANLMEQSVFLAFLRGEKTLSSGRIRLKEKEESSSVAAAKILAKYTTTVGRKSRLISSLSIEDNIFLFSDKRRLIRRKEYKERLKKLKSQFGFLHEIPDKMKELLLDDKIIIELLKAYEGNKIIIVLEDVTGALTKPEVEEIFAFMDQAKKKAAYLVISRFEETEIKYLDRMVLVQNGRATAMSQLMIQKRGLNHILQVLVKGSGRLDKLMTHLPKATSEEQNIVLRMNHVGTEYLHDFNIEMEIGEIQKIYYSDEQTRRDLWGIFSGEVCLERGEVILNQEKYAVKNMAEAVLKGVGLITERPYQNELMENLSVFDNISMPLQEKVKGYWMHNKYRRSVKDYISEMNLSKEKVRDMDSLQRQKIVYEKWLLYMPKVLICDNPFTDVDINMQELTMRMFQVLRKRGIAILILTSNLHTMKAIPGKALYYYKGEAMGEEEIWKMIGQ